MNDKGWERLIERFADGREICNCGHAYYSNVGKGIKVDENGNAAERDDLPVCQYGCAANQYRAKCEIGNRVMEGYDKKESVG